jgi:hypothetical protein
VCGFDGQTVSQEMRGYLDKAWLLLEANQPEHVADTLRWAGRGIAKALDRQRLARRRVEQAARKERQRQKAREKIEREERRLARERESARKRIAKEVQSQPTA